MYLDNIKRELHIKNFSLVFILFLLSYYVNTKNSHLFHTLAELFSIFVALGMFDVARNTYKFQKCNYFTLIGVGYGAVAVMDLFHALSISGLGILSFGSPNVTAQFWIAGRYIEAITILLAIIAIKKDKIVSFNPMVTIYSIVTGLAFINIVYEGNFPVLFSAGRITQHKYLCEYIIISLFILSLVMLWRIRDKKRLGPDNHAYMLLSIALTIVSEAFIIIYSNPHDIMFVTSHIFKVLSFYLMYKALLATNLVKPYEALAAAVTMLNHKKHMLESEINERQKLEEKLLQNESVLFGILNSTTDGILVKSKSNQVLYTNTRFFRMFEMKENAAKEEEINLSDIAIHHFLEHEVFLTKLENLNGITDSFTDSIRMKNGRIIEYICYPLLQKDEAMARVWSFRDITARINEAEDLKRLVDLIPDGIFMHEGYRLRYINSAGANLLGASEAATLIGKNILEFIPKEYVKDLRLKTAEGLRVHENSGFIEHRILDLQENEIDVESSSIFCKMDDRDFLLTIVRDIRERKEKQLLKLRFEEEERQLREALEHDRLKTEFFSTISHELKTPLNIILGVIQLILDMGEDFQSSISSDSSKKYIRMMKQNCYRLLRLINNLIDITKLDTGFMYMNSHNYNIVGIVEDICISVGGFIEASGLELIFDTEIEEKYMACDADKIERILLNLLSNAIKFSKPSGKIEVNICDRDSYIMISVKDSGIGIPEDMTEKIFGRFKQVDSAQHRPKEGSGIGLSLVKALVEAHNGKISVRSKSGEGSEFIIELPVMTIEEEEVHRETASTLDNVERISIEFSDIYVK